MYARWPVRSAYSEIIPAGRKLSSQPDPDNTGGGSMKTRLFTIFHFIFIITSVFAFGQIDSDARKNQVIVYTYDSFISEWGPGPVLEKEFKEATGLDVIFIDAGDGGQIMSRATLEKNNPQADILLGIDNNQLDTARKADIIEPYKPLEAEKNISKEFLLCDDYLITPFDWSHFAMIYDSKSSVPRPESLKDLTKDIYRKKIILMDPRTSTPGLGFVAWTVAVFKENYLDFWKALKPNILTMAPSWSTGYGLFTSGEAPLVISYTTSPAYHVEYEQENRFQAIIFAEGHTRQIEGAGLVKNSANPEGAKKFLDFIVSAKAQENIPLTQWMYPVNPNVKLPESYSFAPSAEKTLTIDNETLSIAVSNVMNLLAK